MRRSIACFSRVATLAAAVLALGTLAAPASAQSLQYATYNLLLPLVSETPTFQSKIYVHNDATATSFVHPTYTGANGSASPGRISCPIFYLAPNAVAQMTLLEMCPGLTAGSNFGTLDFDAQAPVAAYARIESFSGHGFSVDGMFLQIFPTSAYSRSVIGLVRQAAAPTYQSNCFIVNREVRDARMVATIQHGDGSLITSTLIDVPSLAIVRYLDIFAALGAAAGDYANARITMQTITPLAGGNPVTFEFYCTVQNNSFFDADFRYGKYVP